MAIKATIEWRVFDTSNNQKVESVTHTTMVNSYSDIQPKVIDKISQNYDAKALEKDLKLQDKLSSSGDRGGYAIVEIQDDSKAHDIVILVEILSH